VLLDALYSILRRQQFGRRSEQFNSEQMNLLDEAIDADLAAIELELEQLQPQTPADQPRQQPKHAPLPARLPRTEIHHEPESTDCHCGCERVRIGEDISEKRDTRRACSQLSGISVASGYARTAER
jgi:transposase